MKVYTRYVSNDINSTVTHPEVKSIMQMRPGGSVRSAYMMKLHVIG